MIMLQKSCLFSMASYFLLLFSTLFLYADFQKTSDVYGLYDGVENKFKHLSPFHGFLIFEREIPKIFYKYAQDRDPIVTLIQGLFVLQDEVFKPTIKSDAIGTYLNSEIVGKIISACETEHNKEMLFEKLLKLLTINIKQDIKESVKSNKKAETLIKEFTNILLEALEASGHFKFNQIYPKNLAYFILFSFLYAKIADKQDLKPYFEQFKTPEFNTDYGILKSDAQIWNKSYEPNSEFSIFNALISQSDNDIWNYTLENYESIGFALIMLEKYTLKSTAQNVLYKNNTLIDFFKNLPEKKIGENRRKYIFSDCMETALRNLLNLIFYDSINKKFVIPKTINNKSIGAEFYRRFSPLETSGSYTHDEWATIISDIPNVLYLKRAKIENNKVIKESIKDNPMRPEKPDGWYYYELKPSLANIPKIINYLFDLNLKDFANFLEFFKLTCTPFEKDIWVKCEITDTDKKKCTLNISLVHAKSIIKVEREINISFPILTEIISDKLYNLISSNKPILESDLEDITKMMNLYGQPLNYETISYNIADLTRLGYMRYNIITAIKIIENVFVNRSKILEILNDVIQALKEDGNTKEQDWYSHMHKQITIFS